MSIPLDAWRSQGERFTHRGHTIFFRRSRLHADAPVLLLIHGFPSASWDWSPMWVALAARFTLVAPDMIGFGLSAKPVEYDYSIFDQAQLCQDLLTHLGVRRYHVLAHDYGDTVAQELMARTIDGGSTTSLGSVCLLNGGLFPETHRPCLIQRLLASPIGDWIARQTTRAKFARSMTSIFGQQTPPSTADIDTLWALITENDGARVFPKLIGYMAERRAHRERWVGALTSASARSVPVRFINGADDPISGRHMALRYRELVPTADIVLLNGIGHYPQIEAPDAVLRSFMNFHDERVGAAPE